jgi:two-component system chemotaxis sensor kinase CheA
LKEFITDSLIHPAADDDALLVADDDMLEGFVLETLEAVDAAGEAASRLQANPRDSTAIDTLFRCFHSAKGTAGFLGLDTIVAFAHVVESLLDELRSGRRGADADAMDLLERSVEVLRGCTLDLRDHADSATPGAKLLATQITGFLASAGLPVQAENGSGLPFELEDSGANEQETPGGEAWTRVRTDRLDRLLDAVGEMVVAQSMLSRQALLEDRVSGPLTEMIAHGGKIVRELQSLSVGLRMIPLRSTFLRMSRLVRVLSRQLVKPIELHTTGEDTEIDRNLVALIADPLLHLIRNAVDHGIEEGSERKAKGKPVEAVLRLSAYHAGGNIVIELEDDGRGIDAIRIREKALARGLIRDDHALEEPDLLALIFSPGFSTADRVTDVSGRGVGLDVVRRNIEQLRGRIEVDSKPGSGSLFRLLLPLTLAITDGMLLKVGQQRFILPILNIEHSFRPEPGGVKTIAGRGEIVVFRGAVISVVRLHDVLKVDHAIELPEQAILVILAGADGRCAVLVDSLVGQLQVVSRPVDPALGSMRGVAGAAILGDGRVGLILDPGQLVAMSRGDHAPAKVGRLAAETSS